MFWTVLFSILIVLIVLRAAVLHRRENSTVTDDFARLPPEVKLAVLKERLLETPSMENLGNLDSFCKAENIPFDTDAYRPLLQEQLRVAGEENAIALDEDIYEKETRILDALSPLEFAKAKVEQDKGNETGRRALVLEGILRCYSDEKIEAALEELAKDYAPAEAFLAEYRELKKLRDESGADDKSIAKLEETKIRWTSRMQAAAEKLQAD